MSSPTRTLSPEALQTLEAAVKRFKTQTKAAAELGCSITVVNQLLKGKYTGDVPHYEARIRGLWMAETVQCPVYGPLGRHSCLEYQANPIFTNPARSALAKECQTCPNRKDAP